MSKSPLQAASRLYDESDGTIEDVARLCAINSKWTMRECELLLEVAVKCEIARILEGKVAENEAVNEAE